MRHSLKRLVCVLLAPIAATLPLFVNIAPAAAEPMNAAARHTVAQSTPEQAYMVDRVLPVTPHNFWQGKVASVTVVAGQMIVTNIQRNTTSSPHRLYCSKSPLKQSVTIGGVTTQSIDSRCLHEPGRVWVVQPGHVHIHWETFPVVPSLLQTFTYNTRNWGAVSLQLVPFYCIVGPGGACLGVPNSIPKEKFPAVPEWLTSPLTGACVLDLAVTFGVPQYKVMHTFAKAVGMALTMERTSSTTGKVYVFITHLMPFKSCIDLAAWIGVKYLAPVAKADWGKVRSLPPVIRVG
ncbi:hypothetical protein P0Y31_00600 [Knoellia sp. 3-2P3]|uniref:hypothetical protein n=1 Tax=unclassified Knoellia TaxID=2618719 RepID=UPI0023D9C224|nr:hypothetical protein [Knoellia sp. 3-2P3]MDF2090831.1 hypothetical protein [Knoellia sp. 3-2P3]